MLFAGIICILETYYFLDINNSSEKTKKWKQKCSLFFKNIQNPDQSTYLLT